MAPFCLAQNPQWSVLLLGFILIGTFQTDARLMAILYHFFEHLSNIEDLKTYFRRSRSQHHANGVTMIHSTEEGQYLHRNYLVPILNLQLAEWQRIFDAMRERPWPMNSYIGIRAGEKYNGTVVVEMNL